MNLQWSKEKGKALDKDPLSGPREEGTAYYSLLVYAGDRFDHSQVTIICDRGVVRALTYHYHDYLSGRTQFAHFLNPGNGEDRDDRFVHTKLSDLFVRYRTRVNASPDENDEYYSILKDFVVIRFLQLVRSEGIEASTYPLVVHLTATLQVIEEHYLHLLRRPVRDSQRRAGSLEFE